MGFPIKMADKVADLKLTCYIISYENIKYKTKFILPSDTNIVNKYVLLSYSVIFAGQPLFWYEARTIVKPGPVDIYHFNDRTFYLGLYVPHRNQE